MLTRVKVSGKWESLNLTRVHHLIELCTGERLLTMHPERHELCYVTITFWGIKSIIVTEEGKCAAPYRWTITKSHLWREVYKINK